MIGRKEELKALDWDMSRPESQLVVVYGRRRIGKTYLIREKFSDQFTFCIWIVIEINIIIRQLWRG